MAAPDDEPEDAEMKQLNTRVWVWLLQRARAAARYEKLNFSAYVRSAIMLRVRETEARRARIERGEPQPPA